MKTNNHEGKPEVFDDDLTKNIFVLSIVGAAVGLGQLLASKEKLTMRIVVGRALSSAGLGMAAGALMLVYPDINPVAMAGFAALVASLGTSALERIVQKALGS